MKPPGVVGMADENKPYVAHLFRGWDFVTLSYELGDAELVIRTRHAWGASEEKRVAYAGLSGEISHVLARQPAYRFSLLVAAIGAMAVALEFAAAKMMGPARAFNMPLWVAGWAVLGVAGLVCLGTRKRKMWSWVKGKKANAGAFILRNPRDEKGFERVVREVKRRIR
jgi:hypothetical protein